MGADLSSWTWVAGALAAAGLVACGSGASPGGDDWTNGSRLHARVWQTVDGAKQWIAWHDTQRGEDCFFARTADGQLRCFPAEAAFADIFSDAGCTQPMMIGSVACGVLPYAWHIESPCDTGYTLHRRGARLDPQPAAYYFRDYDGTCSGGSPTEPTFEYFALEPAEDLGQLVAAELVREDNGPLDRERLLADDGASQLTGGARDPDTGAAMSVSYTYGDENRWIPDMYAGPYFGDGACTDEIGCDLGASCPVERTLAPFVQHYDFDESCQRLTWTYYAAGGPATEQSYWDPEGMQCVPIAPLGAECVRAEGDPIPPSTFPEATFVDLPGARIRARYDGVEGGGTVAPTWFLFHDTQYDVNCYPLTAIDGSFRCLPSFFVPYANLFEDLDCTVPIAWRDTSIKNALCVPDEPLPQLATWREPDVTPCEGSHFGDAPRRMYSIGDPIPFSETAPFFSLDTGVCAPFDTAAYPGTVYAITELDPSEFVPVSEVVE